MWPDSITNRVLSPELHGTSFLVHSVSILEALEVINVCGGGNFSLENTKAVKWSELARDANRKF